MKEVIVPADDLVCIGKEKLQEVIRCKDCMWHYGTLCRNNNTMPWEDDGFCSHAERRTDETD